MYSSLRSIISIIIASCTAKFVIISLSLNTSSGERFSKMKFGGCSIRMAVHEVSVLFGFELSPVEIIQNDASGSTEALPE